MIKCVLFSYEMLPMKGYSLDRNPLDKKEFLMLLRKKS